MKSVNRLTGRPPIERMVHISRALRRGHRFTAVQVAAELEVDKKTILRDFWFMRDRLGYTLDFDIATNTWTGHAPKDRIL